MSAAETSTADPDSGFTANDEIVAATTAAVSIVSLAISVAALVVVWKKPMLHNAFGYICVSYSIAGVGISSVHLVWCPLVILLLDHTWVDSLLGRVVGHAQDALGFASIYCHAVQSIGQLLAVACPGKYLKLMTEKNTCLLVVAAWLLALAHTSVAYVDGCGLWYEPLLYLWMHDAKGACGSAIDSLENIITLSVIVFLLVCNSVTFSLVRYYRRKLAAKSSKYSDAPGVSSLRDMRYLMQVFIFAMFYAVLYTSLAIVEANKPFFFDDWRFRLLYGTLSYVIFQIIDGLLILICNLDICRCFGSNSQTPLLATMVTTVSSRKPSRV